MQIDRNTIVGFARRVRTNSKFISSAHEKGADVHVVTQLAISLLGLIIFPYHALCRFNAFPNNRPLTCLYEQGWPKWNVLRGNIETLDELVKHLRNALAHYHVRFSSDERQLVNVNVQFGAAKGTRKGDCLTEINASDLKEFVYLFSKLVEDIVG